MKQAETEESPQKSLLSGVLDKVPGARRIVHSSFVRRAAGRVLGRYPLRRTLAGSGVCYEIRDMENFYSAEELFRRELYRGAFRDPISTFIDLGANCGYFACYVAHRANGRQIKGMLVEANDLLIPVARRHVELNDLRDVTVIHGLIGRGDSREDHGELVLSDAHTSSSQSGEHPHAQWKGFSRKIKVPFVNVFQEWCSRFGPLKIDLLKIDIEGSEEIFLAETPSVLPLCEKVVVECHKWIVDRRKVFERLEKEGLFFQQTFEVDEWFETALFSRRGKV